MNWMRASRSFFQHFLRKRVRQVMLADDDLGIDTKVARLPENFDYTSDWRNSTARKTRQLDVHHSAIEFGHAPNSTGPRASLVRLRGAVFSLQFRCKFIAGGNLHLVLNAIVVRQYHIALRRITKQPDNCGMSAIEDPNNSALCPLAVWPRTDAAKFDLNVVAVHGVADRIAWNKHVPVQVGDGMVGHHKAVPILMKD